MFNKNNIKSKRHGFLVDIDSLFDTRLTTLEFMNEEKANNLLMSGYYNRDRDEFPGFNLSEFRDRYSKRNVFTLSKSTMTSLCVSLFNLIGSYIIENTMEDVFPEVDLVINIHPYKLSKEELDMFITCLKIRINNIVPIRVIDTPVDKISTSWIDDNIVVYYCYDWNKWFEGNSEDLIKKRMDNVVIVAPKILPLSREEGRIQVELIEKESKNIFRGVDYGQELPDEEKDPFKTLEKIVSMAGIGLTFHDTREFCIMLPDDVPTPPGYFEFND